MGIGAASRTTRLRRRTMHQAHDKAVVKTGNKLARAENWTIGKTMTSAVPLDLPIGVDIATRANWVEDKRNLRGPARVARSA